MAEEDAVISVVLKRFEPPANIDKDDSKIPQKPDI